MSKIMITAIGSFFLSTSLLSACTDPIQNTSTKPTVDASKIKPAENKLYTLPGDYTLGMVLINPPRAKDGFGSLAVQTIGSYNGLYKLLKDNGLTLGNVMRVRVTLAPDADGKVDYDAYMAEYKKYFGTKQVPVEPIQVLSAVRSLSTPGQQILLEADVAIPRTSKLSKPQTAKAEKADKK